MKVNRLHFYLLKNVHLTDHGHSQKWTMYDLITRVPLIAWSPGRIPSGHATGIILKNHGDITIFGCHV